MEARKRPLQLNLGLAVPVPTAMGSNEKDEELIRDCRSADGSGTDGRGQRQRKERLRRRAIVYVRQSSMGQVIHNQESQRRQYGLVERAHELGFRDVIVIDEDLGRSGSGTVERPGFQRLVGEVCTGEVGAVFCTEASRLARNGRDWQTGIT